MPFTPRLQGLKTLEKSFENLTRPQIVQNARQRTAEEIRGLETRPSLRFINHVFRGFLRDALRQSRQK